jgi:recombinational DNA repair protein RecT
MSNALALTNAALQAPSSLKEVFEVEAFKYNCVQNFNKTTGRSDGELVFERERVLFMKALAENPKLEQCSRFSIYSSFVELFVSGLTLNDGLTYIIPYKETAQFQIGWKGRLEQMSQMPEINYVQEPTVVLTNELADFEYELGESPRVIKHKPAKDRTITETNKIEFVYLVLDTKFGKRSFLMTRQEVLTIRDTYSVPYKYYKSKNGKWPDGRAMDPPFWITNEAEAFKKTLVKRAYKYLPKTPRMKALDEKIKNYIDHEDGTSETVENIDYGIADDQSGTSESHTQETKGATAEHSGGATPQSNNGTSEGGTEKTPRTRRTKEQIAKDEAAKKEAIETIAALKAKTVKTEVGPGGTIADAETHEVISEAKVVSDNPVDDLPSLDSLMNQ